MTNKLMIGAAIGALMVSGALAQSPPSSPPSSSSTPPAAVDSKQAPPAAAESKQGSAKADFVTSQKPDQWLASRFKGTDVLGADNQKIGDVSDVLFDKTGKIEAYVISVGGFLGVGSKEVALAPSSFNVVAGQNGGADKLKSSISKDQLTQAQNFARYEPPRATTGAGQNGMRPGGAGMPGGPRPSTNTPPTGR